MSNEWRIIRGERYPVAMLMQGNRQVLEISGVSDQEDLDRIVDCLNACEGLDMATVKSEGLTYMCESLQKYGRCGA